MQIRIGLENNIEGRSLAWALDHPGLFTYGPDGNQALQGVPQAVEAYAAWMAQHGSQAPWAASGVEEIMLEETWEGYCINEEYERVAEGYEINAWFQHDWKALPASEIQRGLEVLSWSRADLLAAVRDAPLDTMETRQPGQRWNIHEILAHVGNAEWWYLDRLGLAFPRAKLPANPYDRLEMVRDYFRQILPGLVDVVQVAGKEGEFWSPRKIVRRAAWHELDHLQHIRSLLGLRQSL